MHCKPGFFFSAFADHVGRILRRMQPLNLGTAKDMPHKQGANSLNRKGTRIVGAYRYLGTFFESGLKFDLKKRNTGCVAKQGQRRTHLLLNPYSVSVSPLCHFHHSLMESRSPLKALKSLSFIWWYYGSFVEDRNNFSSILSVCFKISAL